MKHALSLKPKILFSFFLIISMFSIIIVMYNNYSVYNFSIKNTALTLNRHAEAYMVRAKNYLITAQSHIDDLASLFTPESMKNIEKNPGIIIKRIKNVLYLSNVFVCVDQGIFVNISWLNELLTHKDLYLGSTFPENAHLAFTIIKTDSVGHIIKKDVRFYDKEGHDLGAGKVSHENLETYLLSSQKKAMVNLQSSFQNKAMLSDISGKVDLSETKKIFKHGYIYAQIAFETFSAYFDFNRVTEKTALFLLDDQNVVLAGTMMNRKSLVKSDDSSMGLLQTAYNKAGNVEDLKNGGGIFIHEGKKYLGLINKFSNTSNLNWKILSIVPIDELMLEPNRIRFNSIILVSLMMFIILIWLYFYISRYSQPIDYLGGEAKKIREFDLEDSIQIESNAIETENLTAEIQNMKTSVKNFSRFIPRGLLEKLINSGQEIEVGGKLMPVTLFFSDIQGFTSISEGMEPNALSLHLSDYLEELTGVIAQNNGTIDKYIGDSIMAFWGAPEADENQTEHACRAALICQQKIQVLNKYWRAQNKPELVTRIGIHCGDAVIGNMGSSQRLNYTAIGDNVNLAARLEGTNKMYGTHILVSQAVVDKLPPSFITRPLDIVAVKGKDVGIKIFELVGLDGDSSVKEISQQKKEYVRDFTIAFDLYLSKEFEKAMIAFEKIENQEPLCAQYIKRCQDFIVSPPPENWDGVLHLKEK